MFFLGLRLFLSCPETQRLKKRRGRKGREAVASSCIPLSLQDGLLFDKKRAVSLRSSVRILLSFETETRKERRRVSSRGLFLLPLRHGRLLLERNSPRANFMEAEDTCRSICLSPYKLSRAWCRHIHYGLTE